MMLNCAKCFTPLGSGKPVVALNKKWHPNCFVCAGCECSLLGKDFNTKLNAPYCETCFAEKFRPSCEKCNKTIDGNTKYAIYKGAPFHNECFCCIVCSKSLNGTKFSDKEGRLTCLAHR